MDSLLHSLLIAFGFGVCLLAICALQWAFFQWLNNFIPHPFKQAKFKEYLAKCLYKGQNGKNNDKYLNPCRQDLEQNESCDAQDYDSAPTGLFSSTFTQFILLLENITGVIIKRLNTKSKQNQINYLLTFMVSNLGWP